MKGLEQQSRPPEQPKAAPTGGDSVRQGVKPGEASSAARSDAAGDQQKSGGLGDRLKAKVKELFKGDKKQGAASSSKDVSSKPLPEQRANTRGDEDKQVKETFPEVPPRDEKGKGKQEESSTYRKLETAYASSTSKAREIDHASLNSDDLRKHYRQVRNTEKELNTKYNQIIKDNKLSTEEGKALLTAKEQYILEVVFVAKDLTRREFQQVSQKSSDYNTDKHITSSYGKSGVLIAQLKKLQQQERILRESLQHEGIQPRDDVSPSKR